LDKNIDFDKWDRLLSKYVSVWIWSIVLGSTAGITYSLPRPQEFFDYGTVGLALLMIYSFVALLSLVSMTLLFRFFSGYIVPNILNADINDKSDLSSRKSAIILSSAVSALFLATIFRIILGVMMAYFTLFLL
jgi:hypothetical protein